MSDSIHHLLSQRGRAVLNRNMGRTVTYQSPDSENNSVYPGIVALYTSAKDVLYITTDGEARVRERIINVEIGTGTGQIPRIEIGGVFILPLGAGVEEWSIESYENSEESNESGNWKRAKCIRQIKSNGEFGGKADGFRSKR